jgi:hypothetical protein
MRKSESEGRSDESGNESIMDFRLRIADWRAKGKANVDEIINVKGVNSIDF